MRHCTSNTSQLDCRILSQFVLNKLSSKYTLKSQGIAENA